ncbi:MAG: ABC transporter permease subunit [Oligoflexia bacterium]|nr:ABC transporter permease subunit [Oligoflexia bacterium]
MSSNSKEIPFWSDPQKRSIAFQALALIAIITFSFILYGNAQTNLAKQNIATGFGFLNLEAGFDIADPPIEYWSDDPYWKALVVGVINTFKVSVIGNIFALIFGTFVGIILLSKNWLAAKMAKTYVEVVRNVPLLLQLFFWYAIFVDVFPSVKEALNPFGKLYLSQRGIVFPVFAEHAVWNWVWLAIFIAFVISFFVRSASVKKRREKGESFNPWPIMILTLLGLPLITWAIGGAPTEISSPELGGFNFRGGYTISPEMVSLIFGLILYTSAFIAEIVRAGIQSVDKGQWEASESLGITKNQTMALVILPQALRVIIPPVTSQILNLTKNSSLAVAIGFADFVSVANTTMNQTGQAIECVLLIMAVYLFFSLSTSLFMNWYNKRVALVER